MTAPRLCMLLDQAHTAHPIVRRQVATLVQAGWDVTVLDRDPSGQRLPDLAYRAAYVPPVSLWLAGKLVWIVLRRTWPGLGEAWWTLVHVLEVVMSAGSLAIAAYRANAQCYQAHDLYTLMSALLAGRLRAARVVYDAHELTSDQGEPGRLRNRFERCLERLLVPHADRLIVPSALRGQVYAERYRLARPPVVVLNCPPMSSVPRSDLLRDRLHLPGGTRIALYHGSLLPGRGLENLVQSARDYAPGTVLVIIGSQGAYYRDVLSPLGEMQDMAGKVYFLPYIAPDHIMPYVASADVGVVIYRNVNLNNYLCAPTKLYEYLMAGVPVVASHFPDLVRFLAEHPVGCTFEPECPRSIAAAVNTLVQRRSTDRRGMERAIDRVRGEFNWEHESRKLLLALAS